MTLTQATPVVTAGLSPYVGLTYFTEANSSLFFGRDVERTVLMANLQAARLTLLYAQSGTGKSSLLRAGVAARLRALADDSFRESGCAGHIPIVFSGWRRGAEDQAADPTGRLIAYIREGVAPFCVRPLEPPSGSLADAVKEASLASESMLLVLLDQFEEYVLTPSTEGPERRFAGEFAACINRSGLRANFLISIREDAYARIGDLFSGRIDNVYANYMHLAHLSREAAIEAIEGPLDHYNALHEGEPPVEIVGDLVPRVLDELGSEEFVQAHSLGGSLDVAEGARTGGDEIAAPYLQLVMKRIWDAEQSEAERSDEPLRLRESTLDDLGGAKEIVTSHVARALTGFGRAEQGVAFDVLHHLVPPSGTKVALTAADLAEYTPHPVATIERTLEDLTKGETRILRPVTAAHEHAGPTRFEISHDLLAPAILNWRAGRLERQAEQAKRRARLLLKLTIAAIAVALGAVAFLVLRPGGPAGSNFSNTPVAVARELLVNGFGGNGTAACAVLTQAAHQDEGGNGGCPQAATSNASPATLTAARAASLTQAVDGGHAEVSISSRIGDPFVGSSLIHLTRVKGVWKIDCLGYCNGETVSGSVQRTIPGTSAAMVRGFLSAAYGGNGSAACATLTAALYAQEGGPGGCERAATSQASPHHLEEAESAGLTATVKGNHAGVGIDSLDFEFGEPFEGDSYVHLTRISGIWKIDCLGYCNGESP